MANSYRFQKTNNVTSGWSYDGLYVPATNVAANAEWVQLPAKLFQQSLSNQEWLNSRIGEIRVKL
jgi:hypothetical protein